MAGERRVILKAAAREFAEVGLNESSLESVASRARLEPGAVRALFVDKPSLLRELLKEATDPLVSGIALAVELMKPEQTAEETMQTRFGAIIDLFEKGLYAD